MQGDQAFKWRPNSSGQIYTEFSMHPVQFKDSNSTIINNFEMEFYIGGYLL